MFKILSNTVFAAIAGVFCLTSAGELQAAPRKNAAYSSPRASKKSYTKKAPYEGYGEKSSVNGRPKTKTVRGHGKRTSKGYTYVNPYAKSQGRGHKK